MKLLFDDKIALKFMNIFYSILTTTRIGQIDWKEQ